MFNLFKNSFLELKKPKCLVICGFLLALMLVIGSFSIHLGPSVRLSFSVIPKVISAFLFGPIPAGIIGGLADILGHYMHPKGSYFPGFSFDAILGGIIYGMFLYKKVYKTNYLVGRVILSSIIVSIITSMILGTLWLSILYGKSFIGILPLRIIKEVITTPIECFLIIPLLNVLNKIYK